MPDIESASPRADANEEPTRSDTPKIYVASLSDYNDGILHGVWINATDEDIDEQVVEMLGNSPTARRFGDEAEEWAIHDYENWHGIPLGEWEGFDKLHDLAVAIVEHGEALGRWIAYDRANHTIENFAEAYCGEYEKPLDYVYEYVEDFGVDLDTTIPWPLSLDWEHGVHEMFDIGPYLAITSSTYTVYVFNTEAY